MVFIPSRQAAPQRLRKTADVALGVYRGGGAAAQPRPKATLGSGPSGELIAGQRALAFLRRGLFCQATSPTQGP